MKVITALVIFGIIAVTYATADDEVVTCPPWNGEDINLLPNPNNCSTYFQCVGEEPVKMDCPKGLHFNNKDKACDWPYKACCDHDNYPEAKCDDD